MGTERSSQEKWRPKEAVSTESLYPFLTQKDGFVEKWQGQGVWVRGRTLRDSDAGLHGETDGQ